MTRRSLQPLAVVVALIAASPMHTGARQNPPRDTRTPAATAPAAPSGKAVVSGTVTTADGTGPVRFAYVLLLGTSTGIVKVSSTDADGRFTFFALPADRYTVAVSKSPYLGAIAGAKRPARPGTPIAVADGQKISDVTIRMQLGGSISGVVTDEGGEPGNPIVVSLQQWRMVAGQRSLVAAPGGSARTDDRGRYRFFGLAPGEYVVSATKPGAPLAARPLSAAEVDAALRGETPAPPAAQPAAPPAAYAPTFYPGTTRATDAASIALGPSEERQGVDFRVEIVQTSRIEGRLSAGDGRPIGTVPVIISSQMQRSSLARTRADGTFAAANLVPGTYTLLAMGTREYAGQFALSTVEVAGADVPGVQLVMQPGLTIQGQLVFDGREPHPPLAGRYVPMQRLEAGTGTMALGPQSSLTSDTGAFTIGNVAPGRYLIGGPISFGPTRETMTWTLQSVALDGRDVTDLPVEISADAGPRRVVVTFSDRHQELSGRLQSGSGAPASEYTIVAFPEDRAYWSYGSRRIVTARPGTDGRFTLSGPGPATLPPGRYLIAAVDDLGRDEQFDPAFLAQLVPAAVPIALAPGEKKVQDLAIR